jgi:copper resistance protein D
MHALYLVSVIVHVLTAALWVGGMGFFAVVVVPAVRSKLEPTAAREVLAAAGLRFSKLAWISLGTLLFTGIVNLWGRGSLGQLATSEFWASPFGKTLGTKLALVVLVALASFKHAHDARHNVGSRTSAMLGRATLILSIVVVVLAIMMVRGV